MKIRKQFQKVSEQESAGEPPLFENSGGGEVVRQVSSGNGGRLVLGKRAGAPGTLQERALGYRQTGHNSFEEQVSPTKDSELTNVDQGHELLEESNSDGSCGDWTLQPDHYLNTRRKYARRSLRSAGGAGTVVVKSGDGYCNGSGAVVASHVSQATQRKPSKGDTSCANENSDHPSQEPEGSLLHCLYLQLLAADKEGMTLKEMLASFASQTRSSSLGRNWREQVKSHLKTNPYFKLGAKARYFLREQPQKAPKASKAGVNGNSVDLFDLNLEPSILVSSDTKSGLVDCDTALLSPDPSAVNNDREGIQTRRKSYERTVEAVLHESAVEIQQKQNFEEVGDDRSTEEYFSAASKESDLHMATPMAAQPESVSTKGSKKRKSPVHGADPEASNIRHITGAVPGSLKAMQARIESENGAQNGVRCSRKDGSNNHSKWQCPMMAIEGKSLCKHHNFLSERKKARYKKAKRQERGMRTTTSVVNELLDLNKPARISTENGNHIDQIDEIAPPAPVNKSKICPNHRIIRTRSDHGSLAECNTAPTTEDIHSETEGGQPLVKPIADQPSRQPYRSTRKPRMYLAAKKTAEKTPVVATAPGKSVKKQSVPLIRPCTIPPLPMMYGVRRKSTKNRSQLTL